MKVAILSDVTPDLLAQDLRRAGDDVYLPSGFNAWIPEILDPASGLHAFKPAAVLVVLDAPRVPEADAALARLAADFPTARICVPDLAGLAAETGRDRFYDDRMRALGAMPFSLDGLRAIEDEFAFARLARPMKVLALDADNTLWHGIISEDGIDVPEPYADFQRGVRALKARGVVLVMLSKNDLPDTRLALERPEMVLHEGDFAALGVNWDPKPGNLLKVCQGLRLFPDSFVFVDDNPRERAEMSRRLPKVVVPPFPENLFKPEQFLRRLGQYFFADLGRTAEDAHRTELYREDAAREAAAAAAPSLADYMRGLGLHATVFHPAAADLDRLAQLAQRTNQFNATTRRRTRQELADLVSDPAAHIWAFRAGDRYGDQGLVGYVIATADGKAARITDFVMSCRAMNRTLEHFVVNAVRADLARAGLSLAGIDYMPTPKNAPVKAFLASIDLARPLATYYPNPVTGKNLI